jgi:hypothetical protein
MDYHGIKMKGPFFAEDANVASFSPEDEGKLRYKSGSLYFGSSTKWNKLNTTDSEIPSNYQILILSNVAISGYILITTMDDELVYITKGFSAGGEYGGNAKIGSTWTQPNHSHSEANHIHSIGSHIHTFSGTTDIAISINRCDNDGHQNSEWQNHSHGISFTALASSDNTGLSSSNFTGLASTVNTWRPLGRNFTIQQRI